MLLVKTKVAPSSIHGVGLIADEFILKGTPIWIHNDLVDKVYRYERLCDIPEPAKSTIDMYGWREGNYWIYPGDNARFTNHSTSPNCVQDGEVSVALRDIEFGEEITEDYSSFDEDFQLYANKLNTAHSSTG